jgi:hypothetical protein
LTEHDEHREARRQAALDQWQAGLRDVLLARVAEQSLAIAALSDAVLLLGRRLAELDARTRAKGKTRGRGKRRRRGK